MDDKRQKKAASTINDAVSKYSSEAKKIPNIVPEWDDRKVAKEFDKIAKKTIYKVIDSYSDVGTGDTMTRDAIYTALINVVNKIYGKRWSKLGQWIEFY